MRLKQSMLVLLLMQIVWVGKAQDLLESNKIWYSSYIYKKIDNRWFADAYLLTSVNGDDHSFAFNQNDFTLNYKLNRKLSVMGGYSFSFYKWLPSYEHRYAQDISPFGTISFHKFSAGITHKFKYRELPFQFKHDLVAQYFVPKLEKYQIRLVYKLKASYRNKNLPLNMVPFAQAFVYYYLNGTPLFYYDDEGGIEDYASPNGIHRVRLKGGVKITPIKRWSNFNAVVYYAYNKELNFGPGNDLNVRRPIPVENPERFRQITDVPFNNYGIIGFQLNFIFND